MCVAAAGRRPAEHVGVFMFGLGFTEALITIIYWLVINTTNMRHVVHDIIKHI